MHGANCARIAAILGVPGLAERAAREWARDEPARPARHDAVGERRPCAVPWCGKPSRSRYCVAHEHRATRYGDPLLCKSQRSSRGVRVLCREVGVDAAGQPIVEEYGP
jgi:hypothetical protein